MVTEGSSLGVWKKGSVTMEARRINETTIRLTTSMGDTFSIGQQDWVERLIRFTDEGWIKEDAESISLRPEEFPPKIKLAQDTVLRRKEGKLYLMTRQETGWNAVAHPVPNETYVLARFNVRLGDWAQDEHGDYCPVKIVKALQSRRVSKPPRPQMDKNLSIPANKVPTQVFQKAR